MTARVLWRGGKAMRPSGSVLQENELTNRVSAAAVSQVLWLC